MRARPGQSRTLYDGPDDDRDPSIVQLPSGRLLCNFFSLKKKAGASGGWDGLGTRLVESDDVGRTWSAPRTISRDYYCSSPIRLLPDGGLILGLYKETDGKSWGASDAQRGRGKDLGAGRRTSPTAAGSWTPKRTSSR